MKSSSRLAIIALASASLVTAVAPLSAQSLRGSHASVSLMYRRAVRGGLDFYETNTQLKRAVVRGELVRLNGNANYTVANVRTPYVRPETRSFVTQLAADYKRACREPMVVTSATRPMSRKLVNSSSLTVHPAGIAIDLRKPSGRCLTWLRRTLITAENRGVIEATEERRPPHFHIAVLPSRYKNTGMPRQSASASRRGSVGR